MLILLFAVSVHCTINTRHKIVLACRFLEPFSILIGQFACYPSVTSWKIWVFSRMWCKQMTAYPGKYDSFPGCDAIKWQHILESMILFQDVMQSNDHISWEIWVSLCLPNKILPFILASNPLQVSFLSFKLYCCTKDSGNIYIHVYV